MSESEEDDRDSDYRRKTYTFPFNRLKTTLLVILVSPNTKSNAVFLSAWNSLDESVQVEDQWSVSKLYPPSPPVKMDSASAVVRLLESIVT